MATSESTAAESVPRKRRWFQFSLRTMLILMLLFGGVFSWLGLEVKRGLEQRHAVQAIQALGGQLLFTDASSFAQRNKWLRSLVGDEAVLDVWVVAFGSTHVTDEGLVHLRGLTQLQWLRLERTQVSDAGLVHLRGLTQLKELHLEGTLVSDAGLIHLRGLTQLQELHLDGTQVSDAGLVHLRGLTQLQDLILTGTQVSDAGLVHLRGLTQLQRLCLDSNQVSDAGVEELQKSLPNASIQLIKNAE